MILSEPSMWSEKPLAFVVPRLVLPLGIKRLWDRIEGVDAFFVVPCVMLSAFGCRSLCWVIDWMLSWSS